jgi:type III secretory pathway component EscV
MARSVVVTYFQQFGTEQEQRYLADAMNHEYATAVAYYQRLDPTQRAAPSQELINSVISSIINRNRPVRIPVDIPQRVGNILIFVSFKSDS